MDEFEKRIKHEFDDMKLPDVDMAALVREQIDNMEADKKQKRRYLDGNKRITYLRTVRRAAAAVLIVIMLCGVSTGVYAGIKGISMLEVCEGIWNHIIGVQVLEQVSCDARMESENNTFGDIDIKPYKIIGDKNGIYIVLQITSDMEPELMNTMAFEDYSISYENDADAALDMYSLGCVDNALYVAVEYTSGISDSGIADAGSIKLRLDNLMNYDYLEDDRKPRLNDEEEAGEVYRSRFVSTGTYKATISYSYKTSVRQMEAAGQVFEVSNLTMRLSTSDEETYYDMLDRIPVLNMKYGRKITAQVDFGIEDDCNYVVIYRLDDPVMPDEVNGIVIE